MNSSLEIFEFVVEGIDLLIDFSHSTIFLNIFLLGSMCSCSSLLENVLFFNAIKSNDHFFFSLIFSYHSFML